MIDVSADQLCHIQNRMSDIRCQIESGLDFNLPLFLTSIGELLGTLDTIFFDERNYGDSNEKIE